MIKRKPCPHNIILPKGLRCNHGYLEILMTVKGRRYCRTFGQHTSYAQKLAEIHLAKKWEEILLGKFELEAKIQSKKFNEVADMWFNEWKDETDSDGRPAHNEDSINEAKRTLEKEFKPLFAKFNYEDIRPIDIERWREKGLTAGRSGTTLNRYHATLSTVFSRVERWVQTERFKPAFKLPLDKQSGNVFNPCHYVKMAPVVKRERILTQYEAKKLKNAFVQLNDIDGWEICKLALKSVLSLKDLKGLQLGQTIDLKRAKTGVPVKFPITSLVQLNWINWRKRWEKARELAGLGDVEFRDLRKTGGNALLGKHDIKLISQYMGHATVKTTEKSYMLDQMEKMRPLAEDLTQWVESI